LTRPIHGDARQSISAPLKDITMEKRFTIDQSSRPGDVISAPVAASAKRAGVTCAICDEPFTKDQRGAAIITWVEGGDDDVAHRECAENSPQNMSKMN
jgi:hypothetical protein